MALSNDVTVLVSAQCSIIMNKDDELQTKIIIWDIKTLRQKLSIHQAVHAIQSMAFSRDDRFLITIGDYRKSLLTLWSTHDYTNILNWQDESSLSYINCFSWNPMRANEFCLGCSNNLIRFCTIIEQTNNTNVRLQIINGQIPSSISEQLKKTCEITACIYLISSINLVLCSTNYGFITCWDTRTNICLLHWKADSNEICFMATIKYKLITGSSNGCLRLWNTESLEMNLGQGNTSNL